MRKKNEQYSENKAKLDNNIVYEYFRESLQKIICKFDETTEDELLSPFFEELYYPSIPIRTDKSKIRLFFPDIDENSIGQSEWKLLSFACNLNDISENDKIMFLLGKIGTGKSTLLHYVFRYLIKSKSLRNRISPIIISCHNYHDDLINLKSDELKEFVFGKILKNHLSKTLADTIKLKNENFWKWYYKKSKTRYSEKISEARDMYLNNKELTDRKILEIRKDEKGEMDFYLFATKYLKEKDGITTVIIFDNLDPFELDVIINFYWMSRNYIQKSSALRIIISLRETTYHKFHRKTGQIDIIKRLNHSVDFLSILQKRCSVLQKEIKKLNKKPLTFFPTNGKELTIKSENADKHLSKLIQIILRSDATNCLFKFADENIRSQLELLKIIFSSGMIPKSIFGKVLITDEEFSTNYVIPSPFIIRAIVTFGHSTFFTIKAKECDVPGVLNVLGCSYNQEEIMMFMKIYILRYLKNHQAAIGLTIEKIKSDWNSIIETIYDNKQIMTEAFDYCLYRLFTCGLISSPDTHYVKTIEDFSINVSEISISPLGTFYLNDLIFNPEYLFFIKDDVYLNDISSFDGCIDVFAKYHLNKQYWINFLNIIRFLKEYGEMEFLVLSKFNDFKKITSFVQQFSTPSEPMITLSILRELDRFHKNPKSLEDYIEKQIFDSRIPNEINNTIEYLEKKIQAIKQSIN